MIIDSMEGLKKLIEHRDRRPRVLPLWKTKDGTISIGRSELELYRISENGTCHFHEFTSEKNTVPKCNGRVLKSTWDPNADELKLFFTVDEDPEFVKAYVKF